MIFFYRKSLFKIDFGGTFLIIKQKSEAYYGVDYR